jgi:hypothetical protein
MNKFNAGDLSKKPKQVFDAARSGGAIIQHKDRQGNVIEKFIMLSFDKMNSMACDQNTDRYVGLDDIMIKGDL